MTAPAPAPYCPDTIQKIRDRASLLPISLIARDLNWPEGRVFRVARQHGIDIGHAPVMFDVLEETAETAPDLPSPPALVIDDISWSRPAGRLVRANASVEFSSKAYGIIVDKLLRSYRVNRSACWITCNDLADAANVRVNNIATMKARINSHLASLGLAIECKTGCGYRLIDLLAAKQKEAAE